MRIVLRRPDFRLFFVASVATMVGESALLLVLAIWVKSLTGSDSLAGITLFALGVTGFAAPLLGWVVDRFPRRRFLMVTLSATMLALVPLLFVHGRDDLWIVYSVAVLYGLSQLLAGAATTGLIKELLPEDLLADANGALQTVRQGLRLVAPIGGAGLFGLFGGEAVAIVDIACLGLAVLVLTRLRITEVKPQPGELHWLGEVVAGVRHLVSAPGLRRATIGLGLSCAVLGFCETVVFSYVDKGLHRGPAFVSVMVCVQGVGGLTGGLLAARLVRRVGEVGALGLGTLLFGVGFGSFAYPNLGLGFGGAVLAGLGLPIAIVAFNTLLQRVTPMAIVSRVGAAADAIVGTPQTLSIAGGALLVRVLDYRVIFAIMGVVMVAASIYLWLGRALAAPASSVVVGPRGEVLLDVNDAGVRQG